MIAQQPGPSHTRFVLTSVAAAWLLREAFNFRQRGKAGKTDV